MPQTPAPPGRAPDPMRLRAQLDLPESGAFEALLDQHRDLDAYALVVGAFEYNARGLGLSAEECLLGARLCTRLGSGKLARALDRQATVLAPDDPRVIYYADTRRGRENSAFARLRDFLAQPQRCAEIPILEALDAAYHARLFASLDDHQAARQWIARSVQLAEGDPRILASQADVYFMLDDHATALDHAERAWSLRPGIQLAAHLRIEASPGPERRAHAIEDILDWSRGGAQAAGPLHLALVATLNDWVGRSERPDEAMCEQLSADVDRLAKLQPLADANTRAMLARYRAQVARLGGQVEKASTFAGPSRSPFLQRAIAAQAENPSAGRQILKYRRIRQKGSTCLPASASVALGSFGIDLDVDALAKRITFVGTAPWRIASWAEDNELKVRWFRLTSAIATELIARGVAFIVAWRSFGWAHASAVVGADHACRTLVVFDPARGHCHEIDFAELERAEAPTGPDALLLLPADRADELRDLELPAELAVGGLQERARALQSSGVQAGAAILQSLTLKDKDSELADYLRALVLHDRGNNHAAYQALAKLHRQHPHNATLLAALDGAARDTRDPKLLRELLARLARYGALPGAVSDERIPSPSALYMTRFADQLRRNRAGLAEAETLLTRALSQDPRSAETLHVLADLYEQIGRSEEAVLAYRWSSSLAPNHEHYASEYARALRRMGRENEGLAWLEQRARNHTNEAAPAALWITWVEHLETCGRHEEALAIVDEWQRRFPERGDFAAAAVPYWLRYGHIDQARAALKASARLASIADHAVAAMMMARFDGDFSSAEATAREWVKHDPNSDQARHELLRIIEERRGNAGATAELRHWLAQDPGHATWENMLLDRLRQPSEQPEKVERLEQRQRRDPEDPWAARELAFTRLRLCEITGKGADAERSFIEDATRAIQLAPGEFVSEALRAELALIAGHTQTAIDILRQTFRSSPSYTYAFDRLCDLHAQSDTQTQRSFVDFIRDVVDQHGPEKLHTLERALRWTERFRGFEAADQLALHWTGRWPDDTRVLEATFDLWIRMGAEILRERIEIIELGAHRHPRNHGLRASYAWAQSVLGRRDAAIVEYRGLVHDFPLQTGYANALADLLDETGRPDEALQLLENARRRAPGDPNNWISRQRVLDRAGRREEQLACLREAARRFPDHMGILLRLAEALLDRGQFDGFRQLLSDYCQRPDPNAAALTRLSVLLARPELGAPRDEIEQLQGRALGLAPGDWQVVHDISLARAVAGDYNESRQLLNDFIQHAEDPAYARGQRALVDRMAGRHHEALQTLVALVGERPEYEWAWGRLIAWIEDDDARDLADLILCSVIEREELDPLLRVRALWVLAKFGYDRTWLETRWHLVLTQWPADRRLLLRRCDWLIEAGEFDLAASCLIEHCQHNHWWPDAQARYVEILACQGDQDRALTEARQLWRNSLSDQDTAPLIAMDGLLRRGLGLRSLEILAADLRAGVRVNLELLRRLPGQLDQDSMNNEALTALAEALICQSGPRIDDALSYVLDELAVRDQVDFVLRLANQLSERFLQARDLWAIAGRVELQLGHPEAALQWVAGWQDRATGLGMWVAAIAVLSQFDLGQDRLCIEAAERALAECRSDHTRPRVVITLLSAQLRSMRFAEFITTFEQMSPPDDGSSVHETLHCFAQLFKAAVDDPRAVSASARRFRRLQESQLDPDHWAPRVFYAALHPRLSKWQRIRLATGLL